MIWKCLQGVKIVCQDLKVRARLVNIPSGPFLIYILFSKALARVCSSANSISPPVGTPLARRLIFGAKGLSSCLTSSLVKSPKVVGLKAMIISWIWPPGSFLILSPRLLRRRRFCGSSSPLLARPPKTRYWPLNFPVFSRDIKSVSFSTMAIICLLRFFPEQTGQARVSS